MSTLSWSTFYCDRLPGSPTELVAPDPNGVIAVKEIMLTNGTDAPVTAYVRAIPTGNNAAGSPFTWDNAMEVVPGVVVQPHKQYQTGVFIPLGPDISVWGYSVPAGVSCYISGGTSG